MPDLDLAGLAAADAHLVANDDGPDGVTMLESANALLAFYVPHCIQKFTLIKNAFVKNPSESTSTLLMEEGLCFCDFSDVRKVFRHKGY